MNPQIPTPKQIREARKLARVTRNGMAAMVGVSPVTIYRWELGATQPRGAALNLLRERLALLAQNQETDTAISAAIAENK